MSTDAVTLAAIADTGAVLAALTDLAARIGYADSVAAATSASGAVAIADVAGLGLLAAIEAARAQLATLVATPASLAGTLVGLVQAFQGTSVDLRAVADGMAGVTWASQIPAAGLYGDKITANRAALAQLVQVQAVIEAARAATSASYGSQEDALALRDDLNGRLDAAMTATGNRALRATLDGLRVAMVTDLTSRAAGLATLETYQPARVLPALVLAQTLYDDPTMAADICRRNGVAHPGFVPAVALTVISDEEISA